MIAIGANANITKTSGSCIVIGGNTEVKGNLSTVLGFWAKANNEESTAIGSYARASGYESSAIGTSACASGCHSTALGYMTSVSGNNSTSMGYEASTSNDNSIQLGGAKLSSITSYQTITKQSDERDKTDIEDIDKATEFLKKVRVVRYVMNPRLNYLNYHEEVDDNTKKVKKVLSEEDQKLFDKYGLAGYDKEAHDRGDKKGSRHRVGVLAQQTYQAMKDVYSTDDYANIVNDNLYDIRKEEEIPDGVENQLGVTYESFIPFLIKGFQEQQEEIEKLKEVNKDLLARIEALEAK